MTNLKFPISSLSQPQGLLFWSLPPPTSTLSALPFYGPSISSLIGPLSRSGGAGEGWPPVSLGTLLLPVSMPSLTMRPAVLVVITEVTYHGIA